MRATVPCHITLNGEPICESYSYFAAEQVKAGIEKATGVNVTCSYRSLAAGRRALRELQRQRYGFRLARGDCPVV